MIKNPSVNAGDVRDMGLIPGSARSPGEENGNPLQYFTWEIPWIEAVVGYSPWVTSSLTQLSMHVHRHSTSLDAVTPTCVASVMRNLAQIVTLFTVPN